MSGRCLYEYLVCYTAINPIRCTWLPRSLVQTPLDSAALCANKRQSHLTYELGTSSSSQDINFVVFENLHAVIRYNFVCSFNYEPCAVINTLWLCYIGKLASAICFVFARSRVETWFFLALYLSFCPCVWCFRYWTAVVALSAIFVPFVHTTNEETQNEFSLNSISENSSLSLSVITNQLTNQPTKQTTNWMTDWLNI